MPISLHGNWSNTMKSTEEPSNLAIALHTDDSRDTSGQLFGTSSTCKSTVPSVFRLGFCLSFPLLFSL